MTKSAIHRENFGSEVSTCTNKYSESRLVQNAQQLTLTVIHSSVTADCTATKHQFCPETLKYSC